jgi:hypothetical protein
VFKDNLRIRTFVKCIKEDGIDNFAKYILRNHKDGVVYHKHSLTGDYDLPTEEAILKLLRDGVVKGG